MIILGIDPGVTGGLALINSARMELVDGLRMPVYERRGKKRVSPGAVMAFVEGTKVDKIVIEDVHAMPRQGVSSSFSFGRSTGAIEAVSFLITNGALEWVTPAVWKKHFGLSTDKQASMDAARLMWGEKFRWTAKVDNGIAEASLIARWFVDKYLSK